MTQTAPTVDVVIPVLNEERALPGSIRRLRDWMSTQRTFSGRITIVDNGSTDATLQVAKRLADVTPTVRVLHLDRPGRGRALKHAWLRSDADIVAYMDVDLSTELDALRRMVAALRDGADIAIGSRLAHAAVVDRGVRREVISRCYNRLLRASLHVDVRDAQCGCKAMHASLARRLMGDVVDDAWFFDTELLVRAQRTGVRIAEIPVRWVEDTDSRVRVLRTALEDIRGIVRLRRELTAGCAPAVRPEHANAPASMFVTAAMAAAVRTAARTTSTSQPAAAPRARMARPAERHVDHTRRPRPRGAVDRLPRSTRHAAA